MGTVWETPSPESKNATSGTTRGVQRKDGLNVDIHGRDIEGLKHDLRHALTIGLWVLRSLRQEDRVSLRGDTELIVEGVVPDLLHIVPVGNNTVLNGVLQRQDTTLGLGFVSDVGITLFHTNLMNKKHDNDDDERPKRFTTSDIHGRPHSISFTQQDVP